MILSICNHQISAQTTQIKRIFAILLPSIFHIASSVCQFIADCKFTNNSGADVPSATTVRPMINGGSPILFAKPLAQSTKKSAHLTNIANPTKSNTMFIFKYTS